MHSPSLSAWAAVYAPHRALAHSEPALRTKLPVTVPVFPATASELSKMTDPNAADKYFVKVVGSKAVNNRASGNRNREQAAGVEQSRKVSAGYYALQVGNRFSSS